MKHKLIASTLGFALVASGALIPSQSAHGVMFEPSEDTKTPSQATAGSSRGGLLNPASGESAAKQGASGTSPRSLFNPASGESALSITTGRSSRRSLFSPKPDDFVPKQDASGAFRGELFTPASDQPTPNSTASGGSRKGNHYPNIAEINIEQPAAILALLPQSYFGTTISQHAEILVYLPKSKAREGVFSLKDAKGNTLHQMTVPVSGKAGVISIKVPKALELEKNYQWFLALKIDGKLSPRTPYVNGWIKRIQPTKELAISMQQKDLLKQATALCQDGVWYNCVATLAKLRATQPKNANLNKHWSELLESVGLKLIDKAPVVAVNNISN